MRLVSCIVMLKHVMNDVRDYKDLMPGWDGESAFDISDAAIEKAILALRTFEMKLRLSQHKFSYYDGENGLVMSSEPCSKGGVLLFVAYGNRRASFAFYASSLFDRYEAFEDDQSSPALSGRIDGNGLVIELAEWLLKAKR